MPSKGQSLPERLLRGVVPRLGVVCATTIVLGGCVDGPRERFFQARGAIVPCHEGDGGVRVAMWPTPGGLNPALAAAEPGRANDTVLPE